MPDLRHGLWRGCFLLAAAFILTGGPQHPGGSMAQMLAHPKWVIAHVLVLGGFLALFAGLALYGRGGVLPERTRRWRRIAIVGTALQAVEMVFHTISYVDHGHLVAGEPTPVLTIHLTLAFILYPVFGVTMAGFILATARERTLASPWIAWLGLIGVVAHGAAPPLVLGFGWTGARILFPMVMLFAFWLVLAAVWPLRVRVARTSTAVATARA
jgi:hypothetical protein